MATSNKSVSCELTDGVLRATVLVDNLDQSEAPSVTEAVVESMGEAGSSLRFLVLDISKLTMLNSMGIAVCIELRNRADVQEARTVLFGANDELLAMLRLVKVDRLFEIATTDAELAAATSR